MSKYFPKPLGTPAKRNEEQPASSILYSRLWLSFPSALLLLAVLLGSSCQTDGKRDIRDYYFPLKALEDGMVYEYLPTAIDSLSPAYWFYRSYIGKDGVFLTATYYEYDLIPLQLVREELLHNGMLVEQVFLYEAQPDSNGQQRRTEVEVLAGNAFPFEVSDSSGVFLYKVRWNPIDDPGAKVTLVKNRRFLGDTLVDVMGEKRKAVVFGLKEWLEYDQEGVFEQTYSGREVYAKGIGLVYYSKQIGPGFELSYALARRYPMEELEQQFEQKIQHEQ